ncbi:hypothetical protein ACJJTC_005519 [Scirpophaga incertulas]
MNTTASFHSESSWSRRCSTETVFSVQGKETDFVQDSSDTELGSEHDLQYEPVTGSEAEAPISDVSSGETEDELIGIHVEGLASAWEKEIGAEEDRDGEQLADSESEPGSSGSGSDSDSDSYRDLPAYWKCARCHHANLDTTYRYCDRCFKIRKNFFPPRPKRKDKRDAITNSQVAAPVLLASQDSGIEVMNSQDLLSQDLGSADVPSQEICTEDLQQVQGPSGSEPATRLGKTVKRRADSAERTFKRPRLEGSDSDSKTEEPVKVEPLIKTVSDPSITVETLEDDNKDLCIMCLNEPKTGVFVHRRVAHILLCYKCAVKVWLKARRCPVCNCKVSNVLKAVVM